MNLACECAKRGVAFDGDDSAAMLRRRLAQDHGPRDDVSRTYPSASARKQSRAARRKAQRRANRPSGGYPVALSWTRSALPSCPSCRAPRRRRPRRARCGQPRRRRRRAVAAARAPAGDSIKTRHEPGRPRRGLAGLGPGARARGDAAGPPTRSRLLKPLAPEPRPSTLNKRGRPTSSPRPRPSGRDASP